MGSEVKIEAIDQYLTIEKRAKTTASISAKVKHNLVEKRMKKKKKIPQFQRRHTIYK